jgi:RNA polymerase sigma-70 factor, ECF subfamily
MSTEADDFESVLQPLLRPGYQLAIAMVGDQGMAEDAVQEAAVKAWRKLGSLRDRSAIEAWFLSIVANQCRSLRRGRWRSVLRLPELTPRETGGGVEIEAGVDLQRALDRLAPDDRLALYLHFYRDLTYEEVGRVMGVSMTAARSRVVRATHKLRPGLDPQEVFADV